MCDDMWKYRNYKEIYKSLKYKNIKNIFEVNDLVL